MPKPARHRTRWTPDQRQAAMAIYAELGAGEASRQTGIPRNTLSNWAKAEGITAPPSELAERFKGAIVPADQILADVNAAAGALQTAAAHVEHAETLDYDKDEIQRMWVVIARHSFRAYDQALVLGDSMAAQRLNNCLGTATDKLQLLSGGATSRRETIATPEEATEQAAALIAVLRARAAGQVLDATSRPTPGREATPELSSRVADLDAD